MGDLPLKHGAITPDFALESVEGKRITREQFRGKQGLVVVFFGSQPPISLLHQLAKDAAEYREIGTSVIGISNMPIDLLIDAVAGVKWPYYMLTDPNAAAYRAYTGDSEYRYAVAVLDTYGGFEAGVTVREMLDLPPGSRVLEWARGAQYRCSV